MPSIALLTYSVKPRGSVVHAACLAEALQDAGADVTLYALAKNGDGFFRPLRVPLVLFPANPAPPADDALVAQRIAEFHAGLRSIAGKHDLYHAEDCLTASALLTAREASLRPVVRTVHHVERFASEYLAECQERSIRRSDLVLSVSARTARDVEERFGRTSAVVYNGVDTNRFAASAAETERTRELGIAPTDIVVLSLGGVEERKNTLRELEAVSEACRAEPRLRWVVVGGQSIWDHSSLERRFDERLRSLPAGLQSRIARVGSVDEETLTWLYQRSDILLSASLHEGWGLAALEAMAARTAVIASRREPFTEFLDDETAVLVEPESVGAIATALGALASDVALRSLITRAAALRASAFTWERTACEHLAAYAALLRKSPSRTLTAAAE